MNQNQFRNWAAIREKGKIRFFVVHGIISYGLPMFVFMAFVTEPFANGLTSREAIVHCVTWPMAGLVFGILMWHHGEYKFHQGPRNK
jgi:hypothetical protein